MGFARVLRLEHTSLRVLSVACMCGFDTASAGYMVLCDAASSLGDGLAEETELSCAGERHVARLRKATDAVGAQGRQCGSYAITGGLGGLGLHAAALVSWGAMQVVRSPSSRTHPPRAGRGRACFMRSKPTALS